ncbi:hypothetical protein SAMN04487962_12526 [Marinobacter segnicrescens]|uniref:Uncharacterized protein n=1 Tax=Marinobacter segnicrescens TaxID=430453 RepID=A0A1I0H8E8_9GAMM|nr:hypothetical protein [Marinobacter segnicrescens]SET79884.1 hypothetical protein SAMN04487962_12526 [Marinobacter segnicrescens]
MSNQLLQYEAGQQSVPMTQLTDSGDRKVFESDAEMFSKRSGFAPVVLPNGVLTGAQISVDTGVNDSVVVGNATANLQGQKVTVAQDSVALTRAAVDTHVIASIVINASGAYEAINGAEGTTFSETRGEAGGPALIPVDAIEVGQVRLSAQAVAEVASSEIYQVPGLHKEMSLSPVFKVNSQAGEVSFAAALAPIHTGGVSKAVYASYAEPIFADVDLASDFQPSENSHSLSSTEVYGGAIASTSTSLNAASFTAYLEDGIADPLAQLESEELFFKFFPDRYKNNYIVEQGKLGMSRSYPAGGRVQGDFTISPESRGVSVVG